MTRNHFAKSICVLLASCAPALADTPLLGQVYPSGTLYTILPEGSEAWPDQVDLGATDGSDVSSAQLAVVLRDVSPPAREQMPYAAQPCPTRSGPLPSATVPDIFDNDQPDNCEVDARVGIYATSAALLAPGTVLAWDDGLTGPAERASAGQPRPLSANDKIKVQAYKGAFLKAYRDAVGTDYDPEVSNIGEIPTLADARIIAQFPIQDGTLRLSEWEMITPASHIFGRFIVDVIRDNVIERSFTFSRFQGLL